LRAVASGPTIGPLGTRAEARAIAEAYGIWEGLPGAVREALSAPEEACPLPTPDATLVGSNAVSLRAMAAACPEAQVHDAPLVGDVASAARRVAGQGPGIHLFGGETTVRVTGRGVGGRNQELALRVAVALRDRPGPWVYLQAGTDGRDGPTEAAGGLVDDTTLARIDGVEERLADNDAGTALAQAGALFVTGPTGTNVADLGVLILG
ncbi:MAG: MOFRL family protein, partial [Shimia sp.]